MITERTAELYEKYKLNWMAIHGYTVLDLVRSVENYRKSLEMDGTNNSLENILDEWENDCGFCGEIWACYDEWEASELYECLRDWIQLKMKYFEAKENKVIFLAPYDEKILVTIKPDDEHFYLSEVIAEYILFGDWSLDDPDTEENREIRSRIIDYICKNPY